jgi:protein-L-isoaspartate(D-aspartate) O-methyltransferase
MIRFGYGSLGEGAPLFKQQKPDRLTAAREFYAKMAAAGSGPLCDQLERAFCLVPREYFLGEGPWHALSMPSGSYVQTPTDDPIHVYQNLPFAIDRSRNINNGEPHLHGRMIGALAPERGDIVLHIGCGTGYYSAILAQLVMPAGKVIAYEIEFDLAVRAKECLKLWDNVEVHHASGINCELPKCQAIYVSAGATRAVGNWLDALADGSRLVFPLTASGEKQMIARSQRRQIHLGSGKCGTNGIGINLLVTRAGGSFTVRAVNSCGFVGCIGATDQNEGASVTAALQSGALWKARSLVRGDTPDRSAVLVGQGYWLSSIEHR